MRAQIEELPISAALRVEFQSRRTCRNSVARRPVGGRDHIFASDGRSEADRRYRSLREGDLGPGRLSGHWLQVWERTHNELRDHGRQPYAGGAVERTSRAISLAARNVKLPRDVACLENHREYNVSKKPVCVLVVEDEGLLRMDTVDLLEEQGFSVLEAANADAAISILEAHQDIHLVFTDIRNARLDGWVEARTLCSSYRGPPIKLIVTSGKLDVGDENMPVGSVFMTKPYGHAALKHKIWAMVT